MLQASFKCETPRLELKSWRTFLAMKRCQRTKIQKVIKLAQSSNKKWLQIRAIAVKLLDVLPFPAESATVNGGAVCCSLFVIVMWSGGSIILSAVE